MRMVSFRREFPAPREVVQDAAASSGQRRYMQWNQALCAHFFSGAFASQPVYLTVDDDVLAEVSRTLPPVEADPRDDLLEAVASTLRFQSAENPFAYHLARAGEWARSSALESPPFVCLLAVYSLVASEMTRDEHYHPNNYYDRLCDMLGVEDEHCRASIQTGYREAVTLLWDLLSNWLNDWDGERGIPTARALDSRRYVSLSISQALVREHDRNQLRRMFASYGMVPGQSFHPSENAADPSALDLERPCPDGHWSTVGQA
jgi:hypothetical protein